MENEVQDVRVVETVTDYQELVKIAMITGIASVIATTATTVLIHSLTEKLKNRKRNAEAKKNIPNQT